MSKPENALEALSELTVVVADTGELDAIERWKPRDATTNPSLILKVKDEPALADTKAEINGSAARRWASVARLTGSGVTPVGERSLIPHPLRRPGPIRARGPNGRNRCNAWRIWRKAGPARARRRRDSG